MQVTKPCSDSRIDARIDARVDSSTDSSIDSSIDPSIDSSINSSADSCIDSYSEVLSTPGHLISLASRGFTRLSEARLKPLGFGVGQLPVLVALHNGLASSQRELAKFARTEQPSMAQMLARMERDGLISRTPDPADGRSSVVALTASARARLPEATAALFQGNQEALAGFSEAEAQQLASLLGRLIANLDRISGAEPAP